jgi:hypothetical protein
VSTRVFDAHVHIGRSLHSGRDYSVDDLLRDMDRHGVTRALVIPHPVVQDHRAAHDEVGRAVAAHPDRLAGAAYLPAFWPPAQLREELRRAVEELGLRALKIQPQYQPVNPLAQVHQPLFEAALEFRLPLVVHTGSGAPFALPSLWQAPAARYPELRIVLAHSGGSVYHLEAIVAAGICPNLYLELSSLMPHHVRTVLAHVDPSRLMIGSDTPESQAVELFKIRNLDVAEAARDAILWRTARRLFDGADD